LPFLEGNLKKGRFAVPRCFARNTNTIICIDSSGAIVGEMRYKLCPSRVLREGENRLSSGTTPTDYHFTGQREEITLGLYFYNARWYDSSIGRFVQADTLVPQPGDPRAWDRYSYVLGNPIRFNDPLGHRPECGVYAGECKSDTYYTGVYLNQLTSEKQAYVEEKMDSTHYLDPIFSWLIGGIVGTPIADILGFFSYFNFSSPTNVQTEWQESPFIQSDAIGNPGFGIKLDPVAMAKPVYCRYCSNAEVDAIKSTGLLRGGRPGPTYFTSDNYSTAREAQELLSLPNAPEMKIEFTIENSPRINGPSTVAPDFGQPGGGIEYWSLDPIKIIIQSVQAVIR
jgi:RHS repeat-associated protein